MTAERRGTEGIIRVSDDGNGIPREMLTRVYGLAFNTKEELVRLQLEAYAREEQLRGEIEALKSEHEIYQRNVE